MMMNIKMAVDGDSSNGKTTTTTTTDIRYQSLDCEERDLGDDTFRLFLGSRATDTPSAGPYTFDDAATATETARIKHNKTKDGGKKYIENENLSPLLDRSGSREEEPKCKAGTDQQMVPDTWPLSFHRHFVRSIFDAGIRNATPSKVMEQMVCPTSRRYSHQDMNTTTTSYHQRPGGDKKHHQDLRLRMMMMIDDDKDQDSRSFREKLKSHLQKFKTRSDRERSKFLQEYMSALDTWTEMKTTVVENDDHELPQKSTKVADIFKKSSSSSPIGLITMLMQSPSPSPAIPPKLQDVVGGRAVARTTFELMNNPSYFDEARATAATETAAEVEAAKAEIPRRLEDKLTEQEKDQAARTEAAMALVQTKKGGDVLSTKDNMRAIEDQHHCSDSGGMTILGFPTLTESERETALGQSILTTQNLLTHLNKVLYMWREQQMTRQQTIEALYHDQRRTTKKRHHHGQLSNAERLKRKRRKAEKSRRDDIVYASPETMNAMIANVQLDDDDRLSIGPCAFDAASNIDKTMTLEPPLPSHHIDTTNRVEAKTTSREVSKVTPMPISESKTTSYKSVTDSDDLEPIQLFKTREVSPVVDTNSMLLQSRLRPGLTLEPQYGQNITPFFSSLTTVRDRSGSNASVDTHDSRCSPYPCIVSHERALKPRHIDIFGQQPETAISVDTRLHERSVDSSSSPFLRTSTSSSSSSADVQAVRSPYQASLVKFDQNPCSQLIFQQAMATMVGTSVGSDHNDSNSDSSKDTIDSLSPSTLRPLPAPPAFGNLNQSMTKATSK